MHHLPRLQGQRRIPPKTRRTLQMLTRENPMRRLQCSDTGKLGIQLQNRPMPKPQKPTVLPPMRRIHKRKLRKIRKPRNRLHGRRRRSQGKPRTNQKRRDTTMAHRKRTTIPMPKLPQAIIGHSTRNHLLPLRNKSHASKRTP